jgi:hypothetical protein
MAMPPQLRRPWLLATPVPALALGLFVMHAHGVPRVALLLQACSAGLALALAVAVIAARHALRSRPLVPGVLALALVAATFTFTPLEGVHRWVGLGPVRLHVSAFASPLVLCAAGVCLFTGRRLSAAVLVLALQAVHVLQPDAGQAAAFGLGAAALFIGAPGPLGGRVAVCLTVALLGGAAAVLRPDPLAAVPHVERILTLAAAHGTGLRLAAILALTLPALSLLALARTAEPPFARGLGVALALYLAGLALVPAFGNFPVPVLGFSPSMLLGVWGTLGLGSGLGDASAREQGQLPPRQQP